MSKKDEEIEVEAAAEDEERKISSNTSPQKVKWKSK